MFIFTQNDGPLSTRQRHKQRQWRAIGLLQGANEAVRAVNRYLDRKVFIAEALVTSVTPDRITVARNTDCSVSRMAGKTGLLREAMGSEPQGEGATMTKNLLQIHVGDLLLFAGKWHAVVKLIYSGKYGTLCFKTYPPVIVQVDDRFEVS